MNLSGKLYVCSGGETFDSIAIDVDGKEQYAAELLCANPELCTTTVFEGGETLRLPVVTVVDSNEGQMTVTAANAPWK